MKRGLTVLYTFTHVYNQVYTHCHKINQILYEFTVRCIHMYIHTIIITLYSTRCMYAQIYTPHNSCTNLISCVWDDILCSVESRHNKLQAVLSNRNTVWGAPFPTNVLIKCISQTPEGGTQQWDVRKSKLPLDVVLNNTTW